jgi:hypothetical protein
VWTTPARIACAGEWQAWGYNPNVGRRPPSVPDPSHIVQMQFEMHALKVPTGFLGIWTPLHGLTVYQVPYRRSFMQLASKVMKMVAEKYLLPEARLSNLPTGRIGDESAAVQESWAQMMHELEAACRAATCLFANGINSSSACLFIQLLPCLHQFSPSTAVCFVRYLLPYSSLCQAARNSIALLAGGRDVFAAEYPLWKPNDRPDEVCGRAGIVTGVCIHHARQSTSELSASAHRRTHVHAGCLVGEDCSVFFC